MFNTKKNDNMNTQTKLKSLSNNELSLFLPKHLYYDGTPLFNYTAYTMLYSIAKYGYGHTKSVAEFYISDNNKSKQKEWQINGEGSFFSSVLDGDFMTAIRRGDSGTHEALCKGLLNKEINF
tara:strand:+ start:152 stop:517 length:366 start_codon:yes stop_codon:yes gene_type:complete